ncbi:MAG: MFS transporter [Robiginitomaculum sp.]|nr:MFS transporter [Robiginitomaculum sp.]
MSAKITGQILTQRKFVPLLIAQILGTFNDNIIKFSLMVLAGNGLLKFGTFEPGIMVALAANTYVIPIFAFSAMAGQFADRFDRTRIMRWTKLGEVFLMGLTAIGFLLMSTPVLFLCLFLMGLQTAFFSPARLASMPYFLNADELIPGNALVSGNMFLLVLGGSLLGTLLILTAGGPLVLSLVLVVCSIIGWIAIQFLPLSPAPKPDLKINPNFVGETFHLLKFVTTIPHVLRPILGVSWFYCMGGAFLAALPIYVNEVLGLDSTVLAVMIATFSIAAATGSVLCGVLSNKDNAILFSIGGLIATVIFASAIYVLSNNLPVYEYTTAGPFLADSRNWPLMVAMFGSSIATGMFVVPLQAMTQKRAAVETRARTLAGSALVIALAAIIGQFALVYTALAGLSVQSVFAGIAIISAGGAIYMVWAQKMGRF